MPTLFPDSVTKRGSAHLKELADRVREGHRAVMFYLVNRSDCDHCGPAGHPDRGEEEPRGGTAAVTADGRVVPCIFSRELLLGRVGSELGPRTGVCVCREPGCLLDRSRRELRW